MIVCTHVSTVQYVSMWGRMMGGYEMNNEQIYCPLCEFL